MGYNSTLHHLHVLLILSVQSSVQKMCAILLKVVHILLVCVYFFKCVSFGTKVAVHLDCDLTALLWASLAKNRKQFWILNLVYK